MPPNTEDITENDIVEAVLSDNGDVGLTEGGEEIEFSEGEDEENMELLDDSKLVFREHACPVLTLDVSKTSSPFVVSGGEDDKGYVWEMLTGNVSFACNGHKNSVTCCGFSADGVYVMTADIGGTVIVHETSSGKRVWQHECSGIEWCQWHPVDHVLFAGTVNVYMWKIPNGECKIYPSHNSKSTCGRILPNGKEMLVGYADGCVKKWDLESLTCIFHTKQDGNREYVTCLTNQISGHLIAYGTDTGSVAVHNMYSREHISSFTTSSIVEETGRHIECIQFSPCGSFIIVGSLDGLLFVWDIETQRMQHETKNGVGISRLVQDHSPSDCIIAACLDGIVRVLEPKNCEIFKEYYVGHNSDILDVALSADGKYILTAGDDHCVRMFEK